ncbi:MAG: hypothetical protein ACI4XB_07685 [Ruminococcus sp.]
MGNQEFYQYNIVLSAPIGDKIGTLSAEVQDGNVQGILSVMEHENPFHGTVDAKGNCEISGTLKTLLRSVAYQGTGFLDSKEITLCLEIKKRTLLLTGTAIHYGGDTT